MGLWEAFAQFSANGLQAGAVAPSRGCLPSAPASGGAATLLRVHSQAGRIAETNLDRLSHKEVVRALERETDPGVDHLLTTGGYSRTMRSNAIRRQCC